MDLLNALYLALIREDALQRTHDLREVFNALRPTCEPVPTADNAS